MLLLFKYVPSHFVAAWTSFKELLRVVELVVGHNKEDYLSDLETNLTLQRPAIIALLENPVSMIPLN